MKRLEMYNLPVNKDKCKFFKDEIEFCGHKIDKHGLHKTEDKIKAILDTPEPQNGTQVRSILGLTNYYQKFLPYISSLVRPLHRQLEKMSNGIGMKNVSGYTYDIEYKNNNKHTNADALSRISHESKESDGKEFDAVDVFMLKQLENICLTNDNFSGLITKHEGPLNYQVEVSANSILKRHADQIRKSDFHDKQGEEIINDKTVELEIIPD
ncbi:unnamed protein product [Mytilus coruscus]|uniref:Reverse transcriptase domain-containing protein n=1 Tax=Mytilus coruscus TaxID=42192 RepID=A0A6J7ZWG8_MYTCO|nr:unnamed protein product [Mytilus coruscus]